MIRKLLATLTLGAMLSASGTLTGAFVRAMTGQPIAGATLNLTLSQYALLPGTFAIVPQSVSCYTTTDGSIVGLPDPAVVPVVSASTAAGSLPGGNYFVVIAYYNGSAVTLASPEIEVNLASAGQITVTAPVLRPAGATGYKVYMSTASGTETLQGTQAGWSNYIQSTALAAGTALPGSNSTQCSFTFNDAVTPTNTYYTATLLDNSSTVVPGFPQNWYLQGASVSVANIVPLGQPPAVSFPEPVVQNPTSINDQSVNSGLALNAHPVNNTSNLGPGIVAGFYNTTLPGSNGTMFTWTPNVAVTITRISAYALTAGVGAGTSTFAVTDGTNTCTFAAILSGTAQSGSSNSTSGVCNFSAGVSLTLENVTDTHASSAPGNIDFNIEELSQ